VDGGVESEKTLGGASRLAELFEAVISFGVSAANREVINEPVLARGSM
jgi:hypothetical protein